MDFEELLKVLEIDAPAEFVYFEQYAEMAERREEISVDAIAALVNETDPGVLTELTESYFEDLLKFVPDDESELYTLIQTVSITLRSLAKGIDDPENAHLYAEEFTKFRNWFLFDGRVRRDDLIEGGEIEMTLMDALTAIRLQNLDGGDYRYDFSEALDYPLDEYIVSLAALPDRPEGMDEGDDPFDDYDDMDGFDEIDAEKIEETYYEMREDDDDL